MESWSTKMIEKMIGLKIVGRELVWYHKPTNPHPKHSIQT